MSSQNGSGFSLLYQNTVALLFCAQRPAGPSKNGITPEAPDISPALSACFLLSTIRPGSLRRFRQANVHPLPFLNPFYQKRSHRKMIQNWKSKSTRILSPSDFAFPIFYLFRAMLSSRILLESLRSPPHKTLSFPVFAEIVTVIPLFA